MGEDGEAGAPELLAEDVVEVLGDEYMWEILALTRDEPKSVEAISEACDVHSSTIYRRVEHLEELGLLEAHQQLDPDGHHYQVYSARLREVSIRLDENGFQVDVDRRAEESAADRFTRLYEGFK